MDRSTSATPYSVQLQQATGPIRHARSLADAERRMQWANGEKKHPQTALKPPISYDRMLPIAPPIRCRVVIMFVNRRRRARSAEAPPSVHEADQIKMFSCWMKEAHGERARRAM